MIEIKRMAQNEYYRWMEFLKAGRYEKTLVIDEGHQVYLLVEDNEIRGFVVVQTESESVVSLRDVFAEPGREDELEGLIRGVFHALNRQSFKWILADTAQANELKWLDGCFAPISSLSQQEASEAVSGLHLESATDFVWAARTDWVYQGRCKGVTGP